MRYILLVAIIILTSCCAKNTIKLDWNTEALSKSQDFWLIQTKLNTENGIMKKGSRITSQFKLQIHETKGDSTILKWTFQDILPKPDSLQTTNDKLYGDTVYITSEFDVLYSVDLFGNFQNVLNWNEIIRYQRNKFDSIFKDDIAQSKLSIFEIENLKETLTNECYLYNKIVTPITMFHNAFGLEFQESQDKQMVLSENCHENTEYLGREGARIFLLFSDKLDKDIVKKEVNSFSNVMGVQFPDSIVLDVRDSIIYDFNIETKLPTNIEFWRSFNMVGTKYTLAYTINKK